MDFVRRFYNKSYPEAEEYLPGGCSETLITSPPVVKEIKPFELPPKNDNMRCVYAYLLNRRGVDRDVDICVKTVYNINKKMRVHELKPLCKKR